MLILVMLLGATVIQAVTITGVKIINSETNTEVGDLTDGMTLDVNFVNTWNLRILTDPADDNGGGKVVTVVTAPDNTSHTQSEGGAPFAAFGDNAGDYDIWADDLTLMNGDYILVSYLDVDEAGTKVTIHFTVKNDPNTAPPPAMLLDFDNDVIGVDETSDVWFRNTNGTQYDLSFVNAEDAPGKYIYGEKVLKVNIDTFGTKWFDGLMLEVMNDSMFVDPINPYLHVSLYFSRLSDFDAGALRMFAKNNGTPLMKFVGGAEYPMPLVDTLGAWFDVVVDLTPIANQYIDHFEIFNFPGMSVSYVGAIEFMNNMDSRDLAIKGDCYPSDGIDSTYDGTPFFVNDGAWKVPGDTIPWIWFDKGPKGETYDFGTGRINMEADWRREGDCAEYYDALSGTSYFGVRDEGSVYGSFNYNKGYKTRHTIDVTVAGDYTFYIRVHHGAFRNNNFAFYKKDDMNTPVWSSGLVNCKDESKMLSLAESFQTCRIYNIPETGMPMPASIDDLGWYNVSKTNDWDSRWTDGNHRWKEYQTTISFAEAGEYVWEWEALSDAGAMSSAGSFTFLPASDTVAPTAPSNVVTVDSTQEMISIAWDAATDNYGVVNYEVYLEGVMVASTQETMAVITGLDCGSTLNFEIRAVDQRGNFTPVNYVAYNHICQGPFDAENVPTLPGTILASEFDVAGREIAYHDLTDGNSGAAKTGDYRPGTAVDIAADFLDEMGIYNIGWVVEGEWLEYTLDSIEAGKYTVVTGTSSPSNAGGGFLISLGEPTEGSNLKDIAPVYFSGGTGWPNYFESENTEPIVFDAYSRVVMRIALFDTSSANANIGNLAKFIFTKIEDTDNPTAPGMISYVDSSNTWVTLVWNAATDLNGIKGYNVYVGDSMVAFVKDTLVTVENLDCNTSYDFSVEAVDYYDKVSDAKTSISVKTVICQEPWTMVGRDNADSIYIDMEEFDIGGQGYAFESNRTEYSNSTGGAFRDDLNIELYGDGGDETLRLRSGQWYEYTIDTLKTGYYRGVARYEAGGTWTRQNKVFIGEGPFGENFVQVGDFNWPGTGGWGTFVDQEFFVDLIGGDDVVMRIECDNNLNANYLYLVYVPDTAAPVMINDMLQQDLKLPDTVAVSWQKAIEDLFVKYYEVDFNGNVFTTKDTLAGFGGLMADTSYTLKVRAYDAELKTSEWITLEVVTAGSQFPYMEHSIVANPDTTVLIEAEYFDNGGMNAAYYDNDTRVGDALDVRPFDKVDLEYNDDSTMTYIVDINDGEFVEYALLSVDAGLYDLRFNVKTLAEGKVVMLIGDGPLGENLVPMDTFDIEANDGSFNVEVVESTYFVASENKVLRFEFLGADSLMEFDWFSFTYVPDTLDPEQPQLTVVDAGVGSILMAWDPCGDNMVENGYPVRYEVLADGNTFTTSDTSYSIQGLLCGTAYDITVSAIDAAGNVSPALMQVSTGDCPPQEALTGVVHTIPGMIEVENYDMGGLGLAYFDKDSKKGDKSFRADDIVDVIVSKDTADAYVGYDLSYTKPGEWLEYSLSSVAAGSYNVTVRQATTFTYGSYVLKLIVGDDTTVLATIPSLKTKSFITYDDAMGHAIIAKDEESAILRLEFISSKTTDVANVNFVKFDIAEGLNRVTKSELKVYPNPSNRGFNVDMTAMKGMSSIEIFDLSGRMVFNEMKIGGAIEHVSSSVFTGAGMYLMKVTSKSGTSVARLIVD